MRFRFTLRDLLWLTVVAALAVGWWLDHKPPTPQRYRVVGRDITTIPEPSELLLDNETGERRTLGRPYKAANDSTK